MDAAVTNMLYLYFLIFNLFEMLFEAWISARNSRALIKKGAIEIAPQLLPIMIGIYAIMYVSSWLEFRWIPRATSLMWIAAFAFLFCAAKALKFWAVSSLGSFWTMRVLILPQSPVVTGGPYRWIRHPNYVAVLAEIAATPLIGRCYFTFAVVMILFSIVLALRIRYEEAALKQHTNYADEMSFHGRFLP
jgi:methyltransferase